MNQGLWEAGAGEMRPGEFKSFDLNQMFFWEDRPFLSGRFSESDLPRFLSSDPGALQGFSDTHIISGSV